MAYVIGWAVYLVAALGLVGIYWRFFEGFFQRELGALLRVLLIAILFTPWIVTGATSYVPAPACVAVLFAVLSHSSYDAFKALIPILAVSLVGILILLFVHREKPVAEE